MRPHASAWSLAALTTAVGLVMSTAALGSAAATVQQPSPVLKVGFVNTETGPFSSPEITRAAKAAAAYINLHGGVHGRLLQLVTCGTDGTAASSTTCANRIVAAGVPVVLNGKDAGLDAALPLYKAAGVKIFGVAAPPAVSANTDQTLLEPPNPSLNNVIALTLQHLGISKLVFALPEGGAAGPLIEAFKAFMSAHGIEAIVTTVAATNPDFTAVVDTAESAGAQSIMFSFGEADCTQAISSIKTAGYQGTVIAGPCSAFIDDLGEQAEGVYSLQAIVPYSAKDTVTDSAVKADLETYTRVLTAFGLKDDLSTNATWGYSSVMTFADALGSVKGPLTADAVRGAVSTFKGRSVLGGPVDCTAKLVPGSACGRTMALVRADGDETTTLVSGAPLDVIAPQF